MMFETLKFRICPSTSLGPFEALRSPQALEEMVSLSNHLEFRI